MIALNLVSYDGERNDGVQKQFTDLAKLIQERNEDLKSDLLVKKEHISIFQRIRQLENSQYQLPAIIDQIKSSCAVLELNILLEMKETEKLADWVLKNKEGVQLNLNTQKIELFNVLREVRNLLIKDQLLKPEVGEALSHLMTCGLGLEGTKDPNVVKGELRALFGNDQQRYFEGLAHWINKKKLL